MPTQKPLIILAGPNGAGKSTVQPGVVPPTIPFVNADNIARELRDAGRAAGTAADLAAGRLLVARLGELEKAGSGFAVETNLANRTLAQRIPRWQSAGYRVSLFFVWVPSADFAIRRVQKRVAAGGHDIPEETIRRRYQAGLQNLFKVYLPLVDTWRVYDNTSEAGPRVVAYGWRYLKDHVQWERIRTQAYQEGKDDGREDAT